MTEPNAQFSSVLHTSPFFVFSHWASRRYFVSLTFKLFSAPLCRSPRLTWLTSKHTTRCNFYPQVLLDCLRLNAYHSTKKIHYMLSYASVLFSSKHAYDLTDKPKTLKLII